VNTRDKSPAGWKVEGGVLTVVKQPAVGNIRRSAVQELSAAHRVEDSENITGTDQARGNSGVFLGPRARATAAMSSRSSTFDNKT
jgi:hypothetical protein